jgi:hypothetical protein
LISAAAIAPTTTLASVPNSSAVVSAETNAARTVPRSARRDLRLPVSRALTTASASRAKNFGASSLMVT